MNMEAATVRVRLDDGRNISLPVNNGQIHINLLKTVGSNATTLAYDGGMDSTTIVERRGDQLILPQSYTQWTFHPFSLDNAASK